MTKKTKHKSAAASPSLYGRLADLYARMHEAYRETAAAAGLSCENCPTNCCTSYFRHHTYIEWAYLWRGLSALPENRRAVLVDRARDYLDQVRHCLDRSALPTAMCPLNEEGLCILYPHRLMICRMHGTRNTFTLPDGTVRAFSGCARFTALPRANDADGPSLDRTPFYKELAALEAEFHKRASRPLPRVDLTLAEMMVLGPPKIR